jgi:hypothetical protein
MGRRGNIAWTVFLTKRKLWNQIVHDSSEANTLKPLVEAELSGNDSGFLDMRFSEKYPITCKVRVSVPR